MLLAISPFSICCASPPPPPPSSPQAARKPARLMPSAPRRPGAAASGGCGDWRASDRSCARSMPGLDSHSLRYLLINPAEPVWQSLPLRRTNLRPPTPGRPPSGRDQVHVLGKPSEPHSRAGAGQPLAPSLVGVRNHHRQGRVAGEPDDHLGRRAEIDRCLDQALDAWAPPRRAGRRSARPRSSPGGRRSVAASPERSESPGRRTVIPASRRTSASVPELDTTWPGHQVGHADEARDELGARPLVDLLGRVHLLDHARGS